MSKKTQKQNRHYNPEGTRRVVTHGYTDGRTISVCDEHESNVPSYSPRGASYSGVQHGSHQGYCDVCASVEASR